MSTQKTSVTSKGSTSHVTLALKSTLSQRTSSHLPKLHGGFPLSRSQVFVIHSCIYLAWNWGVALWKRTETEFGGACCVWQAESTFPTLQFSIPSRSHDANLCVGWGYSIPALSSIFKLFLDFCETKHSLAVLAKECKELPQLLLATKHSLYDHSLLKQAIL